MAKFTVNMGFFIKDKAINTNSIIEGKNGVFFVLTQENGEVAELTNTIKLTDMEIKELVDDGYIIPYETSIPTAKFKIGDFVRVLQVYDGYGRTYNERYLKKILSTNYDYFTKGIISEMEYSETEKTWLYRIVGISNRGINSDDIYVIRTYGNDNCQVCEDYIEKTEELDFIIHNDYTLKINIAKA